jgi:hypothetical protein
MKRAKSFWNRKWRRHRKRRKQIFGEIPRGLLALETGTHSPWVSRLLRELEHQVLVAHAQKVQLISKSNRKDDRPGQRLPKCGTQQVSRELAA